MCESYCAAMGKKEIAPLRWLGIVRVMVAA